MSADFLMGGFRDVPAWHGGGITRQGGWVSVLAGMIDTGVIKHHIALCDIQYTLPDGTLVTSAKKKMLVRAPIEGTTLTNWEEFKPVDKDYSYITKERLAEILSPLADKDKNGIWPLETLGLLGQQGDRLLITLKMESSIPNGDEKEKHDHYLFLADDYRGQGSLSVMVTSVRVVCQNTWNMAFSDAERKMTFSHTGDLDSMLEFRVQLEKAALEQRAEAVQQFEAMMKFMMTKEQRTEVLETVFPELPEPKSVTMVHDAELNPVAQRDITPELLEKARNRAMKAEYLWKHDSARNVEHRVNVAQLFNQFNDEYPTYGNSAYALLNAVNEYADWRTGRGQQDRAMQVLYRGRATEKRKAFELVSDMMKKE